MFLLLPPDLTKEEYNILMEEVIHYYKLGVSSMLLIDKKYYKDIN